MMKLYCSLLFLSAILQAESPTPWDRVAGSTIPGSATIVTKAGKKLKSDYGVKFTTSSVELRGTLIPRQDIREIVVRETRESYSDSVVFGLLLVLGWKGLDEHPKLWPVTLAVEAVAGPSILVVEGIRRLKPAGIVCRVLP